MLESSGAEAQEARRLSEREPSRTVFARYMAYQIPGTVLAVAVLLVLIHWEQVTPGLAMLLIAVWVLKDLALFPVTRIGYERGGRPHGADALVGAVGSVQEEVCFERDGWVRVGPELWRARLEADGEPVPGGAKVRVLAVHDLTLRVSRLEPEPSTEHAEGRA